jgi:hypothetical protein
MTKPPKGTLPAFAPVPRLCDRSNGWKPEVQRAFIEALAETGSVEAACRRVNRSDNGAYLLRRHPEAAEFRKAWEAALALGMQRIEDVAMERALNGVEVPVYHFGQIIGTRRVYNDRLLMFMLRNRAPKRFAADGARGMNAVDQAMLKRLKKQWRAEWEAERRAQDDAEEEASVDSLNDYLENMLQNRLANQQILLETQSAGDDPDGDEDKAENTALLLDGPPDPAEPPAETPKEPGGPRVRTLRDDRW